MSYLYDLTDTWNASGTVFNAIKMNVTNTASAAGSKLVVLQVGSTDRFSIDKDGNGYFLGTVQAVGGFSSTNLYLSGNSGTIGMQDNSASILAYNGTGSGGITNTLRFTTGAAERMRITGSGDVGIGTSSPAAKLDVNGSLRANSLSLASPLTVSNGGTGATSLTSGYLVKGNGTSAVSASVVYDNGTNVGIGTAAPGAKLDVSGTTNSVVQQWQGAGNSFNLQLKAFDGTVSSSAQYRIALDFASGLYTNGYIDFFRGGDGATGFLTFGTSGTERMRLDSAGNLGVGTASPVNNAGYGGFSLNGSSGSIISMMQGGAETFRVTNPAGYSFINTTGSTPLLFGTNATERMRITEAGAVGIGTSSPGAKFDVSAATTSMARFTGPEYSQTIFTGGTQTCYIQNWNNVSRFSTTGATPLTLGTNDTERVRITAAGDVGIGTSSPATTLHVGGQSTFGASTNLTAGAHFVPNDTGMWMNGFASYGSGITSDSAGTAIRLWAGGVERVRIADSGNVGIGVSSPSQALHVRRATDAVFLLDSSTAGYGQVFAQSANGAGLAGTLNNTPFALYTNAAERVRIDASGNLLVGYTAAYDKLQVAGSVSSQGGGYFGFYRNGPSNNITTLDGVTVAQFGVSAGVATGRSDASTWLSGFDSLRLVTAATERMRLDASGNVGIGTSAPISNLDVTGSSGITTTSSGNTGRMVSAAGGVYIGSTTNADVIFQINQAEKARIDTSGNLGLGVTPSAWGSIIKAYESNNGVYVGAQTNATPVLFIGANSYYDTSWKYKSTGFAASQYQQLSGTHAWYTAPSGTAGSAVSFTQAMTLDTSGNLTVGNATGTSLVQILSSRAIQFYNTGAGDGTIKSSDDTSSFTSIGVNKNEVKLYTANTERARIDASGNLLVGTTSGLSGAKTEIRQNADANYSTTFTTGTTKNLLALRDLSDVGTYSTPFSTLAFAAGSSGAAWATITGVRTASQSSAIAFGTANGSGNTEERMRIDASGSLLVGTTSASDSSTDNGLVASGDFPGYIISRRSSGAAQAHMAFINGGANVGGIQSSTTTTSYNTSSDARLKHDIVDAPEASSLIDAIKVRSFKWNADNSEQRYGMVAQELLEVAPEAVSVPADEDEMMGVDYSKLVPMMLKEIQSLRARVAQLEGN